MTDKLVWLLVVLLAGLGVWAHGFSTGKEKGLAKLNTFVTKSTVEVAKKVEVQKEIITKEVEKEVVRTVYRDKYIPTIVKETEYVTAPLATCSVSADVVRLWNNTSACALQPSASTCGTDFVVPDTSASP